MDTDPEAAIGALEQKLDSLEPGPAARFAEAFIVSLLGDRRASTPILGAFRTPGHLKKLYVLMHKHIRVAEDIERAGKGVYSPTQRDDAQDARNRLFNILSEIPGEATYRAMLELASEHPEPGYRSYMRRHARDRAVADGNLTDWSADQVCELIGRLRSLRSVPAA